LDFPSNSNQKLTNLEIRLKWLIFKQNQLIADFFTAGPRNKLRRGREEGNKLIKDKKKTVASFGRQKNQVSERKEQQS